MRSGGASIAIPWALAALATGQVVPGGGSMFGRVDLRAPEVTFGNGVQVALLRGVSADGRFVFGQSRLVGGGDTIWVHDRRSGTTRRIGFLDAEHTGSDGHQNSVLLADPNRGGLAAGFSIRPQSSTLYNGQSAWVYDPRAGTLRGLGFVDGDYTDSSGGRASWVRSEPSETGFVAGTSTYFHPVGWFGETTWVFDPARGSLSEAGLTGSEFTREFFNFDARRSHSNGRPNEEGDLGGASTRYVNDSNAGLGAWFYDHGSGTTTRIGFWGGGYTRSDGYQLSNTDGTPNSAGVLSGFSNIYAGGTQEGRAAWVYDARTGFTTEIGLLDALHTAANGGRWQEPRSDVTDSGHVIGTALQESLVADGRSAWIHDVNTGATWRIGLVDAEHSRSSDGLSSSRAHGVNEGGFAWGTATRYGNGGGTSVWIYSSQDDETRRIGLADPAHSDESGFQQHAITAVGDASRWVAGYSMLGAGRSGQTAWIYDYETGTTTSFEISLGPGGDAHTVINDLTDAFGLIAVGSYREYAETGDLLGDAAFAWSEADGVVDLNEAYAAEAAAQGFARLTSADLVSENGWITGHGDLASGGTGVFLLRIPEPGTGALALLGACILTARRRSGGEEPAASQEARDTHRRPGQ